MLSSWSANNHLPTPDAVIVFSPTLDNTFCSSSFKKNRKTDLILGKYLGKLNYIPSPILQYLTLLILRHKPCNPLVSPLFYPLNNLPPTLIQASSSEMLLDDSIKYTNKARQAGSQVTLQIWQNQIHGWQLFNMGASSAKHAWREVEKFIESIEIRAKN